jgi:hypothetical protein
LRNGGREDLAERFSGSAANKDSFIDPEIKACLAQNQETVVHEDWICEFVGFFKSKVFI